MIAAYRSTESQQAVGSWCMTGELDWARHEGVGERPQPPLRDGQRRFAADIERLPER